MGTHALRLLALGLLVATLGAGCGGREEIPAATATAMTADLEAVDQRVRAGECDDARATVDRLEGRVRETPGDIDSAVRRTLTNGVKHLEKLVASECKQKPEPVEESVTPVPVVPQSTPPAMTQPEQQPSEPVEPKPEEPKEPEKPEKKPEQPEKPEKPEKPDVKDICGENPSPRC